MVNQKKLSIAITGANGFVGKNIRKILSTHNIDLTSLSRKNFKTYTLEKKIIIPNLLKIKSLPKLKNCNALIHLIGIGNQNVYSDFVHINVTLTKKIISLCKKYKIKKIVYISGLGVSKNSISSYFISKFKAEQEIINSGLDYTIFRASYIIGKDDPLTRLLENQIKKGTIIIPGSGRYRIQPIFVNDVAEIILKSIVSKQFSNKILDLVGPDTITFKKYVKFFNRMNNIQLQHVDIEKIFYDALHNQKNIYGLEDLNVMLGDFIGDHKKIQKISNLKFNKFRNVLQARSLS